MGNALDDAFKVTKLLEPTYGMDAATLARRIRQVRIRKGYTQQEVCARIHHRLSQPALSELEQGRNQNPTLATLYLVAWGLGVNPWDLLNPNMTPDSL